MSLTPTFHPLCIADLRRETADCISLAFDVPAELRDVYQFLPGQYLTLRTVHDGEELRRTYSICTSPDDGELRVAIKRVPDGRFSEAVVAGLAVGGQLDVMTPMGRFGAGALANGQVYVALAAGSGITPVISILRHVLTREARSRFILLLGNRTMADIVFRQQLEDLKDRNLARLSVFHVLSREQQDLPALNGRLDGNLIRAVLPNMISPGRIDQVFICGPLGMIETAPSTLADLGVPSARVHIERFTPAENARQRKLHMVLPGAAPRAVINAIQGGRRMEFPLHGEDTLIEAATRAGLDLPYSCKGGMCCTCRAKLVEGEVNMAVNYSLEPWETAAGFVLTCQSRPTSARVTVDYDQV